MTTLEEALADRLRAYRRTHSLSQAQLGRMLGYSQSLINKVERGNPRDWRGDATLTLLDKLAALFHQTTSELVSELAGRAEKRRQEIRE